MRPVGGRESGFSLSALNYTTTAKKNPMKEKRNIEKMHVS